MSNENERDPLVEDLDTLQLPEAPDLKGPVMVQLAARRTRPRPRVSRLVLGLAWAAAAALLLVIVVRHPAGPAQAQSSATMAPRDTASWPLVTRAAAAGGAVTVRCLGDRYAFFLEVTGPGVPTLRWDPAQWQPLAEGGNPVLLRRRPGPAVVSLWVGGAEVLNLPVAAQP